MNCKKSHLKFILKTLIEPFEKQFKNIGESFEKKIKKYLKITYFKNF